VEEHSPFEPTLFTALWRYRFLAAAIIVLAAVVGAFFALRQPPRYEAAATLVVEDPRATALFGSGVAARPERYVNNQASILVSGLVAERASSIARAEGQSLSAQQITDNLEVTVLPDSDEIEVRFDASNPERAAVGANSVAAAYEEVRLESASQSFDRAVAQLDSSIETLNQSIAEVAADVEAARLSDPSRAVVEEQYRDALTRFAALQREAETATGEELDQIRAELDDVLQQLQTLESVIAIELTSPELTALLEEQEQLIARRSELRARRDGYSVDASLESSGIVLFSPALASAQAGSSVLPTFAAAIILGGLLAAVASYALAVRNRRFTDKSQPEIMIGSPLLAAIPDFRAAGVNELAVLEEPDSEPAEGFRFVVAALEREGGGSRAKARMGAHEVARSFVIVSAAVGDGKSAVAANLALATAMQSKRVLVVDADFGDQRVSQMLIGVSDEVTRVRGADFGLTDLVKGDIGIPGIVKTLEIKGVPPFDVVTRGTAAITAPQFFSSGGAKEFFSDIRASYDVILIDAPPLLQVAYASSLVELSDRAVVVVPHRSSVGRLEELAGRLAFLHARVLGYVYTKGLLRADLPNHEGSMADILGTGRTA